MHATHLIVVALAAAGLVPMGANAVEIYGGAGTTGAEIGVSARLSESVVGRLDYNALNFTRRFTTSNIDYDAKLKASNAGVYLDYFVTGGFRLTGGALIGNRNIHGTARSIGGSFTLGGVAYPAAAGDTLDFDAKFPTATPYLGIGFGHHLQAPGLRVYADAGVAYGRPKLTLSPSASLASKVNPADLRGEQRSAQEEANGLRAYPVLKIGISYRF